MDHRDRTRRVAETFDDWARRGRGEGMERGHRRTADDVLAGVAVGPGDRFLDLGAGIGWAARDAASRGAEAVAVDASRDMLERAAHAPSVGPPVHRLQCAFEALPFGDGSFHAAWSMEALYYAADLEGAVGELHRVLAPGGSLTVLVDFYEENEASVDWPEKTGLPMHRLSEAGWRDLLGEAGFADVSSRRARASPDEDEGWKARSGTLVLEARA